jgi:signal transduction histidine kinase
MSPAKILIIDDEPNLLMGLGLIIKRAGYEVLTAPDGQTGLETAKTAHPNLVICDVMMPPPNGFELRRMMNQDPDLATIPFIFLTARNEKTDMLTGLDTGADDYITKPFDRKELLARVNALLRRQTITRITANTEMSKELQVLRNAITNNISQEIRTPLASILGMLEEVLSDRLEGDPKELREYLENVLNSTQRVRLITDDLIYLSNAEQGQIDLLRQPLDLEFSLHQQVQQVAENWKDRNLQVKVHHAPQVAIAAPRFGFERSVSHLVDNACKFSKPGGHVLVIVDSNGPGGCVLSVVDEGPGIPADLREKAFGRPLQNNKSTQTGLGIGLNLARTYARSLGGDVRVLNVPKGASIQMVIPPIPQAAE